MTGIQPMKEAETSLEQQQFFLTVSCSAKPLRSLHNNKNFKNKNKDAR